MSVKAERPLMPPLTDEEREYYRMHPTDPEDRWDAECDKADQGDNNGREERN